MSSEGIIKACLKGIVAFFAGYGVKECPDVETFIQDAPGQQRIKGDIAQRSSTVTNSTNSQFHGLEPHKQRNKEATEDKPFVRPSAEIPARKAFSDPDTGHRDSSVGRRGEKRASEPKVRDGSPIARIDKEKLFDDRQDVADSEKKVNPGKKVPGNADVANNPLTPIATSSTSAISDQQPEQSSDSCFSYVPETRDHDGKFGVDGIQTVKYIKTSFTCYRSADEVIDLFETDGLLVTKSNYPFAHLPGGGNDIEDEHYSSSLQREAKKNKAFVCTTHVENQLKVPLYKGPILGLIMEPDNISEILSIGKVDIFSDDDHKGANEKEVEQQIRYHQRTGVMLDKPQEKRDSKGNIKKKKMVKVGYVDSPIYETREQLSEGLAYDQLREKQGLFSRQDGRRITSAKLHNEVNIKTKHPHTIAGFLLDKEIDNTLPKFDLIVTMGNLGFQTILKFCYIICNNSAPLFKYDDNGKMMVYDRSQFLNDVIRVQFTEKLGIPHDRVLEQMKLLSGKEKSSKDCMNYLLENRNDNEIKVTKPRQKVRFQSLFETLTRFKEDLEKHPVKPSAAQKRAERPGVAEFIDKISLDPKTNTINKEQFVTQLRWLKKQDRR